MTKFYEIKDPQREYLVNLYLEVLKTKIQEDQDLNRLAIRAPLLANAAGLAAVITFVGVLVQAGKPHSGFAIPLALFIAGAGLAALIQVLLLTVASQAVTHVGTQLENFIQGRIDLEQMQGWGLSPRGRVIVLLLFLFSSAAFGAGSWAAFRSLLNL